MVTREYKALKNHLHNTLGLSKDDIRKMVEDSVERIVEKKLDRLFKERFESQYSLQNIIDESINQKITERNWFWGESESTLDDYVKKEIVDKLLNNVKLKVEVVKNKKDATPRHPTIKIQMNKKRSTTTKF